MKRYAVADIGTNSARLMIAHESDGRIVADFKTLRLIRVGEGMAGKRRIVPAAMRRAKDALCEYIEISRRYGVARENFYAFGTSAVRDAENGREFSDFLAEECGVTLDIVSGDQEALLGFAGSIAGDGYMFDIGGGSTEVMQGRLDDVRFAHSFPVGTVRMLQMFPGGDDADPAAFKKAHALAARTFADVPKTGRYALTGIGGTATALAMLDLKLTEYDARRVQDHVLTLEKAQAVCAMLESKTKEQRKALGGLPEKKADVIVFGAILFVEFMLAAKARAVTVSDSDNQEGYLKFRLGLVRADC